jgi:hypothetical protein
MATVQIGRSRIRNASARSIRTLPYHVASTTQESAQ